MSGRHCHELVSANSTVGPACKLTTPDAILDATTTEKNASSVNKPSCCAEKGVNVIKPFRGPGVLRCLHLVTSEGGTYYYHSRWWWWKCATIAFRWRDSHIEKVGLVEVDGGLPGRQPDGQVDEWATTSSRSMRGLLVEGGGACWNC